jgi:hypothetical protein
MALGIQCVDIDTVNPDALAQFWQQALGWRRTHDTPDEVILEPPAGSPQDGVAPELLFLRVPEGNFAEPRTDPSGRSAGTTGCISTPRG